MGVNDPSLNVDKLLEKWRKVGVTDMSSLKKYIADNPINIAVFTEKIDWSKANENNKPRNSK